ncbi:MAG: hypothetical protein LBE75_01160 [Burkholderiales bacterium]|jgi:hypothetical protein|nr:hypothetical protein [Burkholderiales bacterium]
MLEILRKKRQAVKSLEPAPKPFREYGNEPRTACLAFRITEYCRFPRSQSQLALTGLAEKTRSPEGAELLDKLLA